MRKECIKARELITLFLDKRIDNINLTWLNKHISSCNFCAKEFKEIKKITGILKILKQESLPVDFYFKLNKSIDEIEAKRKNNVFIPNLNMILRTGLVFVIVVFGFVVTLKFVKDNQKFVPPVSEIKKMDNIAIKREKKLIDDKAELNNDVAIAQKSFEMPVPSAPPSLEMEYKKPGVSFNLVSTNDTGSRGREIVKHTFMQTIPGRSYYKLYQEQIQDNFGLKVFGFVIDNEETLKNIRSKYNINEFTKVDFQLEMLILIATEDNSGYSVEIVNGLKEINKIVILYRLNRSGDGKKYDIKVISKTQLPVIFKRIE